MTQYAASLIREIPDFPSPGILFKDITPLLKDGRGLREVVDAIANLAKDADIILIADTGSTDKTVELGKKCGAVVHNICELLGVLILPETPPLHFYLLTLMFVFLWIWTKSYNQVGVKKLNVFGKKIQHAFVISLTGVVESLSIMKRFTTAKVITGIIHATNTQYRT